MHIIYHAYTHTLILYYYCYLCYFCCCYCDDWKPSDYDIYAQFVDIAIDSSQQVDLAVIDDGSSMLKQNNRLILMR